MQKELYDKAYQMNTRIEALKMQIENFQEIIDSDLVKNTGFCCFGCVLPSSKKEFLLTSQMISLIIQELKKEITILEKEFEKL